MPTSLIGPLIVPPKRTSVSAVSFQRSGNPRRSPCRDQACCTPETISAASQTTEFFALARPEFRVRRIGLPIAVGRLIDKSVATRGGEEINGVALLDHFKQSGLVQARCLANCAKQFRPVIAKLGAALSLKLLGARLVNSIVHFKSPTVSVLLWLGRALGS